jgi:GAF domain-containing protein
MSEPEHHTFAPFAITGDRAVDDAEFLDTLRVTVEPSNGSYLVRYASLANAAALLGWYLKDINWAGFYLRNGGQLILGPFRGLPACTRIPYGQGVCGTAFARKKTIRVDNVHEFPGHIACDGASNSEIVTPIIVDGEVAGVLDIDSPLFGRFTEADEALCAEVARIVATAL